MTSSALFDTRAFAHALPPENLDLTNLNAEVCRNISDAVAQIAQQSNLHYSIDGQVLERVVSRYLAQAPEHNNPLNLVASLSGEQARVDYYDLMYCIDPQSAPHQVRQGRFDFIPELGRYELCDGKACANKDLPVDNVNDEIHELKELLPDFDDTAWLEGNSQNGEWEYIPQMQSMGLVKGTFDLPGIPFLFSGKFEYVDQIQAMALVDGKQVGPGDATWEGAYQFIPELGQMELVQGRHTEPDGPTLQGKFQYSEALGQMELVDDLSQIR